MAEQSRESVDSTRGGPWRDPDPVYACEDCAEVRSLPAGELRVWPAYDQLVCFDCFSHRKRWLLLADVERGSMDEWDGLPDFIPPQDRLLSRIRACMRGWIHASIRTHGVSDPTAEQPPWLCCGPCDMAYPSTDLAFRSRRRGELVCEACQDYDPKRITRHHELEPFVPLHERLLRLLKEN